MPRREVFLPCGLLPPDCFQCPRPQPHHFNSRFRQARFVLEPRRRGPEFRCTSMNRCGCAGTVIDDIREKDRAEIDRHHAAGSPRVRLLSRHRVPILSPAPPARPRKGSIAGSAERGQLTLAWRHAQDQPVPARVSLTGDTLRAVGEFYPEPRASTTFARYRPPRAPSSSRMSSNSRSI
jgi:hypothetical protein